MYTLKQLRRLRWLVLITVLGGIAASITMNVLHAPPNPAARFVATIPPLAVFGALELIARIPSSSRGLTRARILGAASVAFGAAAISYAQQRAAVHALGFPMWEATIWPAIIDGFMVVASVSLVEVVRKVRELTRPSGPTSPPVTQGVKVGPQQSPAPSQRQGKRSRKPAPQRRAEVESVRAELPGVPVADIASVVGISDRHTRRVLNGSKA